MSAPVRNRALRRHCIRCINCSILLAPNLRRYTFEELLETKDSSSTDLGNANICSIGRYHMCPMLSAIAREDFIKCYQFHEDMSPAYGHLNICFGCGVFIANRRTHKVQLDCLQKSTILKWTPAHLMACLERVCIAYWLAATFQSQLLVVHDGNRPDNVMENSSPTVEDTVNCKPRPMPAPGIPITTLTTGPTITNCT